MKRTSYVELDFREAGGAIAEAVERGDAHLIEHVQIEIAHRGGGCF